MKNATKLRRREFVRRMAGGFGAMALLPELLASRGREKGLKWRIGHHFWNWDRAWDNARHFELRLRLTRETGYEGFEGKEGDIGWPAERVREFCGHWGVECAAIGGGLRDGLDYTEAAGAGILRTRVPKEETGYWVETAGARGIILVIHPHVSGPNTSEPIETREDLLRYLDERPGVYACPDTGHLALCGSDPVQTIYDLGDRCRYIHLKDILPWRVGRPREPGEKFCELGTGALDLPGVIRALEDIRYEGWIMIERDSREPDYVESARRMRSVMRVFGY